MAGGKEEVMFKGKIEANKIICIVLCATALIGFLLPAINISIEFFGNSRNTSLSVSSFFNRSESPFGDSDLSQADLFNLSGENMFSDVLADVGTKVATSVGAYFLTLLLLIIFFIFTFLGKLRKSANVMLAVSFALMAYAGTTIISVPETLLTSIESSLGFLARFINISEMFNLTLGNGYWLTIIMIGCTLLVKVILYIYSKYSGSAIIK